MTQGLLHRIERFLKESEIPPSVFGRDAVRDPRLVRDLREGRVCGRAIACRAEHYMNMWRAERHAGRARPRGDRRLRTVRLREGGA